MPVDLAVGLSALLFLLGMLSALLRRGLLSILIGIEYMLAAGNLALLAFAQRFAIESGSGAGSSAHVFALLILTVAIAQLVVGLGVVIAFHRNRSSLDVTDVSLLRW